MLPPELLSLLEEYDEDNYDIFIAKAEISDNTRDLKIEVHIDAVQAWEITIGDKSDHQISLGFADFIELKDDHPLLWKYSSRQGELYFSGETPDPEKVFMKLFELHFSLFEGYIPIDSFLNTRTFFPNIFGRTSGLMAKGPKRILEQISDILVLHGFKTSIIGRDCYWKEGKPVANPIDDKVLFIGSSYIVGRAFEFKRLM